ncbi:MAG: hypothetical protein U0U70_10910 [Chitinophagaceae bacterium]
MADTIKNDEQLIEHLTSFLYNGGTFGFATITTIYKAANMEFTKSDGLRILRRLDNEGLISCHGASNSLEAGFIEDMTISLSKEGRTMMLNHGSYKSYKKALKRKSKNENIDRNIRNGNIVAALIVSVTALILTQCPIGLKKRQQKIEEGIQSIARELDSLKKVLQQPQIQSKTQVTKDTATNK